MEVLQLLQEGNRDFKPASRFFRDHSRQLATAALGQFPFAAILSCIDSRAPVETILDLGLGDVFSIRIAGTVVGRRCWQSRVRLRCGGSKIDRGARAYQVRRAVTASVNFTGQGVNPAQATGCSHLGAIVDRIADSIIKKQREHLPGPGTAEHEQLVNIVTRENILHSVDRIVNEKSHSASLGQRRQSRPGRRFVCISRAKRSRFLRRPRHRLRWAAHAD